MRGSTASGIPDGLKGQEISLYARILLIADAFDSMTADRPYRHAPGVEYVMLVEAFLRVMHKGHIVQ